MTIVVGNFWLAARNFYKSRANLTQLNELIFGPMSYFSMWRQSSMMISHIIITTEFQNHDDWRERIVPDKISWPS